jgi:serpin B
MLAGMALFAGCKQDEISLNLNPVAINLPAQAHAVIQSNNTFGLELFTKVSADEPGNLMLSPLSASAALTMLLNGCAGETFDELKATLAYPESMSISDINETYKQLVEQLLKADPKVQLGLANAIFHEQNFAVKQGFVNTLRQDFNALVQALDFSHPSALNTINGWANDNTNGRIPKVLDNISSDAVMFLMNALYFKGDWTKQFEKNNTSKLPFQLVTGSSVQVDMMQARIGSKSASSSKGTVLELPYGRTNFTMVLVLPSQSIDQLLENLSVDDWQEWMDQLAEQTEWREQLVHLPKFKFSNEKILNDQLKAMGMEQAFSSAQADLSGIADANIFVSFVKQDTFVEVNEEGTEAAAVTTIGVELTSAPAGFFANRPFLFAIRERTTNTLLFVGKVMNPNE